MNIYILFEAINYNQNQLSFLTSKGKLTAFSRQKHQIMDIPDNVNMLIYVADNNNTSVAH